MINEVLFPSPRQQTETHFSTWNNQRNIPSAEIVDTSHLRLLYQKYMYKDLQ